jgi:hypothetical protein
MLAPNEFDLFKNAAQEIPQAEQCLRSESSDKGPAGSNCDLHKLRGQSAESRYGQVSMMA